MPLQVLESLQLKQEVTHIEEERIQVVNNIEELEQKIKDLENQMEESVREVVRAAQQRMIGWGGLPTQCCPLLQMEVECALLEGEHESDMGQLQREKELLEQLKGKLHSIEKTSHAEKSQVRNGKPSSPNHIIAAAIHILKSLLLLIVFSVILVSFL